MHENKCIVYLFLVSTQYNNIILGICFSPNFVLDVAVKATPKTVPKIIATTLPTVDNIFRCEINYTNLIILKIYKNIYYKENCKYFNDQSRF